MTRLRGRPRLPITPKQVENLAAIDCTAEEIAAVLDCDRRTIQRNFDAALQKGWGRAHRSVKRALFGAIMQGNVTAAIFWLKCRAGWKEAREPVNVDALRVPIPAEMLQAALAAAKAVERPGKPGANGHALVPIAAVDDDDASAPA